MSPEALPRRPYRSPRRDAEAAATRRAIVDAATATFVERGYVATTIDEIAARAVVSPKTVYATFGSKRHILEAVLDRAIAGDDAPIPILERPWVAGLRAATEPEARLAILAREGAAILARRSAIDEVVREAATTDPGLTELAARLNTERRAGQAALLRLALAPHAVDETAIDTLYALGSPAVHRLLTRDRGWSQRRFATWYAATLRRLFLPGGGG